jgi:hypothetical protein
MKNLPFCRFRFILMPQGPLRLPEESAGTILRGAFGMALRKMVCVFPTRQRCMDCPLRSKCAYGIIFDPSPPSGAEILRRNLNIPRPFVIHPPLKGGKDVERGGGLSFHLTLIGSARAYWPHVFLSIQSLGEMGLGPLRVKFAINQVTLENPASLESISVYQYEEHTLRNEQLVVSIDELARRFPYNRERRYALEFLSPTVIKSDERIVSRPAFSDIVKRLRDRV